MLTIFSIPKEFSGHNKIIQENAIRNWQSTIPKCEIILFGDDKYVAECSRELGIETHIKNIKKNEYNTPLLDEVFKIAQDTSKYDTLMYVNCDMLFTADLIDAIKLIKHRKYIITGQRWDVDINAPLNISQISWSPFIKDLVSNSGCLHSKSGMDYFIFPKGMIQLPPFAVGRPFWDAWLLNNMKNRGIPIIDGTNKIFAIHQNHDFGHSKWGQKKYVSGPELLENASHTNDLFDLATLRSADYIINDSGVEKPSTFARIISYILSTKIVKWLLAKKRKRHYSL